MSRPFNVYLDENVNPALATWLAQFGYDVIHSHDCGMDSTSDEEQLAYAAGQDRFVLTHNMRHFQRLHREYQQNGWQHGGVGGVKRNEPRPRAFMRFRMILLYAECGTQDRRGLVPWGLVDAYVTRGGVMWECPPSEVKLAFGG